MGKESWKGGALLAPVPPTMVSCGTMEHPNILTIAWTGIINTKPPKTYISVRPSRYSYELIKQSGEFVINLTTSSLVRAADFCGVRSGKDINKFECCQLTPEQATVLSAPMIAESPLSMECKVSEIIPLGTHDMFLAEVVNVSVSDEYFDKSGKFHFNKTNPVCYSHGCYYTLGEKLGGFGYSVKKKKGRKK